jgi:hypothetical protein
MAIKLRNNTTTDMMDADRSSIGKSYNKMIGLNNSDFSKFTGMLPDANQFTEQPSKNGFYKSMSGLEGASMRLANAASQRSMAEAGYGSGLKRGEAENEYGLRDISTAKEYGLKGDLLGKEYGLKDTSMAKEYGLKDTSMAKEYGLKGTQAAQIAGYSSPFEMQADIARQRLKQKRQEDLAEITSQIASRVQSQGPYTIDRRGRRVYS